MIQRHQIVAAAREHLGTPFKHQGRVPHVGLDCVGLLVMVARTLGIEHTDARAYARQPGRRDGKKLMDYLLVSCDPLPSIDDAKLGSVLVFEFLGPEWPQHVGIRTDKGIIHTYSHIGCVTEHGYDAVWRGRTVAALDFKGVY